MTWGSLHYSERGSDEWMGWAAPEVTEEGLVVLIPKPYGWGS